MIWLLGAFATASRLRWLQQGLLEVQALLGGACLHRQGPGRVGGKGTGWGVRRFPKLGLAWWDKLDRYDRYLSA